MIQFIYGCALFYLCDAVHQERPLIITTASGPVKGKLNEFNGTEFYTYQGIPYAESPTGKLRFKPPVPKMPWKHVLDATQVGAVCTQPTYFYSMENTTEDCLNLNVYVPRNGTDKLLPVLVFIHGGALLGMSGRNDINYGPQFLLGRQMISVSMNYRLGPLGFLSLGIEEASGNAGLKDVLLSLKWIKKNIKKFGGDPSKITISGHSSGSLIVNLLMLTNQSDGLFNQAIQLSGSAFTPRSFAKYCTDNSLALAKELGIETDDVYKTLEGLQKIDALKIIKAHSNMSKTHDSPIRLYAPFVVSKEVESDHALFVMDPIEMVKKNVVAMQKVPILLGIAPREAIYMVPFVLKKSVGFEKLRENPEYLIPSNIEYPVGSQRSKNLAKQLNEIYFGGEMQNFTLETLIDFMSDTQNFYGSYWWIKKYKSMADSKALYLYMFDFNGNLNKNKNSTVSGVGHGDDVPYIFVANKTIDMMDTIDEKSRRMLDTMINFVSNFVHYGNPTPVNVDNNILWPDYDEKQNFLLINENPVVRTLNSTPMYSRMLFWEKVYDDYYEYVENGGEIEKKAIP